MKKTILCFLVAALTPMMLMAQSDVVINELMAKNDNTVADEAGDYDDWIELYNNSDQAIDLEGYFISDNPDNLFKWMFPAVTIDGNGYLILWADEDQEQGILHTNFKLSSAGEVLFLFNAAGDLIDEIEFGPSESDISYARFPNGTGPFMEMAPTFNAENSPTSTHEQTLASLGVQLFPNPSSTWMQLRNSTAEAYPFQIMNLQGQVLKEGILQDAEQVGVSTWPRGTYILQMQGQGFLFTVQ